MKGKRPGIVLGALLVASFVVGGGVLADDEQSGDAQASPGSLVFSHTGNGPCHQYQMNEWLRFADQHVNNDPAVGGVPNYIVDYTIDIYEWDNNLNQRGAWITGATDTLGPNQPGNPGGVIVNTQNLAAQFTGWNQVPSCWTFEIYRTMNDHQGGPPATDDFLL